jgi:hypothetical protein
VSIFRPVGEQVRLAKMHDQGRPPLDKVCGKHVLELCRGMLYLRRDRGCPVGGWYMGLRSHQLLVALHCS